MVLRISHVVNALLNVKACVMVRAYDDRNDATWYNGCQLNRPLTIGMALNLIRYFFFLYLSFGNCI